MKIELTIGYKKEVKNTSGDSEEVIITPDSEIKTCDEYWLLILELIMQVVISNYKLYINIFITYDTVFLHIKIALSKLYQFLRLKVAFTYSTVLRNTSKCDFSILFLCI